MTSFLFFVARMSTEEEELVIEEEVDDVDVDDDDVEINDDDDWCLDSLVQVKRSASFHYQLVLTRSRCHKRHAEIKRSDWMVQVT